MQFSQLQVYASFLTRIKMLSYIYILLYIDKARTQNSKRRIRSSYKERMVDALALGADEGRDKLR